MLTARENLRRAVEFRRPQRLPVSGYEEQSDTIYLPLDDAKPPRAADDPKLAQWLCRWAYTDLVNMGQVKGHPLEDLSALADYPFPDPHDPRRYANVPQRLADLKADPRDRDKYRMTGVFMLLWERMQALHGFENCMMDILDNEARIHELADRIADYDIALIRNAHRVFGQEIDAFNFTEDWGTENDLMMSPQTFGEFFLPRYKRIFAAVHDCGWHVWMHSCGRINRAIPMLIEAGVDILNLQQPLALGIADIGREFAGKVCFETLCDIQKTLPRGNRDEIHAQVRQLMRSWGTLDGGFILGDYGGHVAIGVEPSVKTDMLQAARQSDPWTLGWQHAT